MGNGSDERDERGRHGELNHDCVTRWRRATNIFKVMSSFEGSRQYQLHAPPRFDKISHLKPWRRHLRTPLRAILALKILQNQFKVSSRSLLMNSRQKRDQNVHIPSKKTSTMSEGETALGRLLELAQYECEQDP
jgi:hypothetical protein